MCEPVGNMPVSGNMSSFWRKWHQHFDIYMIASGLNIQNNAVKTFVLLHSIGPEALCIIG